MLYWRHGLMFKLNFGMTLAVCGSKIPSPPFQTVIVAMIIAERGILIYMVRDNMKPFTMS